MNQSVSDTIVRVCSVCGTPIEVPEDAPEEVRCPICQRIAIQDTEARES